MVESEMLRWEWSDVYSLSALWKLRGKSVRLIWTPIEELDAWVLTLLAPCAHVFGNFSAQHRAFSEGRARFSAALSAREDVVPKLDELCADIGTSRKSFLAYVPFGGLSQSFGDRYAPDEFDHEYFLVAGRHESIAVPMACREAVSRYFRRSAEVFAGSAFVACDEDVILEAGHEPAATCAAIGLCADVMTPSQRNEAIGWLSQAIEFAVPPASLGYMAVTYGAELALPLTPETHIDDAMVEVLRLRTRLLVERASLPAVERAKASLESPGWEVMALADLREDLRGQLDARLCPYPIAQTAPFALWPSMRARMSANGR